MWALSTSRSSGWVSEPMIDLFLAYGRTRRNRTNIRLRRSRQRSPQPSRAWSRPRGLPSRAAGLEDGVPHEADRLVEVFHQQIQVAPNLGRTRRSHRRIGSQAHGEEPANHRVGERHGDAFLLFVTYSVGVPGPSLRVVTDELSEPSNSADGDPVSVTIFGYMI